MPKPDLSPVPVPADPRPSEEAMPVRGMKLTQ